MSLKKIRKVSSGCTLPWETLKNANGSIGDTAKIKSRTNPLTNQAYLFIHELPKISEF